MRKTKVILLMFFTSQILLSQKIEVFEEPYHDTTLGDEEMSIEKLIDSEKSIPIFLVDEGLILDGCENEISIERTKQCSMVGLAKLVKNGFDNELLIKNKTNTTVKISVNIYIDKNGKVIYDSIVLDNNSVNIADEIYKVLETEIRRIIPNLPNLTPAKRKGELQIVSAKIKI